MEYRTIAKEELASILAKHVESKDCWCEPELIEGQTENGGVKYFLHKELQ